MPMGRALKLCPGAIVTPGRHALYREHSLRVISHDVGGGFGSKISPYPEDYLVPASAKLLGRAVKYTETRTEAMQNAYAGRGQIFDVEVAAKKDGTLLAMRCTQLLDAGAYIGTFGAFQTCACLMAGGVQERRRRGQGADSPAATIPQPDGKPGRHGRVRRVRQADDDVDGGRTGGT